METNNNPVSLNQPETPIQKGPNRNILLVGMVLSVFLLLVIAGHAYRDLFFEKAAPITGLDGGVTAISVESVPNQEDLATAAPEAKDPVLSDLLGDFDKDGMINGYELENGYDPKKDEKKEAVSVDLSACEDVGDPQVGVMGKGISISGQGQCIRRRAVAEKNIFVCDRIGSPTTRGVCYSDFSQMRKNPQICERAGSVRFGCYLDLSAVLDRPELCDIILSPECYKYAAFLRDDASYCEKIKVSGSGRELTLTSSEKADCYIRFAKVNKDISYCDKAKKLLALDGDGCYQILAQIQKDSSLCNGITSKVGVFDIKKECLDLTKEVIAGHKYCHPYRLSLPIYAVNGKRFDVEDITCL